MRTDETATAEVEIDRASVLRAIRMDHADVQNVGALLDDIVEYSSPSDSSSRFTPVR